MTVSPNDPLPVPNAKPAAKVVACPGCGASIPLRALGQSVMLACPNCGSEIDISRPDIQLIRKYQLQTRQLRLPLGARGKLRGQLFEVVGAMQRGCSGFHWEEYLLFNPTLGFRWLVHDHGHWNLGQVIRDTSAVRPDIGRPYQGHVFRKYNQGPIVVDWVVGEFYWRVAIGDTVMGTDYVSAPLMLSCERNQQEITWTLLTYLDPKEILAAFHIECPDRLSVAANQPNSVTEELRAVWPIAFFAIVLAFLIQLLFAARAHHNALPLGSYSLAHTLRNETQVFGPFTLTAGHSVNELFATTGLDNAWVELNCTLVNTDTGQSIHFTNAFEYYTGYDTDGAWSDGSRQGHSLIGSVPAGTYNLIVEGSGADQNGRPVRSPVQLTLQQDVATWRNFWVAVVLVLLYPVYLLLRSVGYERQRWSDSDYSPFSTHSK